MIYLIGGPPRCGKSTLARKLAALTGASWVPADYLTTIISGYISAAELPVRLPRLGRFRDNDEKYARFSAAEIIQNYRIKAEASWQAIQAFTDYAVSDAHSVILDGYQIEPRFVQLYCAQSPQHPIRAVFLYRMDVDALCADLKRSTTPNDWVLSYTKEEVTFAKIAAMIGEYSAIFRAEAARYELPAFNIDGDFEQRVAAVLAFLQRASAK
jgi:2-phosphoglycerate kinase